MKLYELLRQQSDIPNRTIVLVIGIAAISNVGVLAVINNAAQHAAEQVHSFRELALFILTLLIFVVSERAVLRTSTREVESILHRLRMRMMSRIRHADLLPLESIGRAQIDAGVAKETLVISQAAPVVIMGIQSAIVVFFVLLYLAWLSPWAFILAVGFLSIAVTVHFNKLKLVNAELHEALRQENRMFDAVSDILEGFKEIKMNAARSNELYTFLNQISESATTLKITTKTRQADHIIWTQAMFFLLVASIIFLLPQFSVSHNEVVLQATTTIVFLLGPLSMLVGSMPVMADANAAAENIDAMDRELERITRTPHPIRTGITRFDQITLETLTFNYASNTGDTPFGIGPIELDIRSGEILFLTGGNGTGKSTLLKLIVGLYFPEKGSIRVDGIPITDTGYDDYRSLFSIVFSDYHLFQRLYGLSEVDSRRVDSLLQELGLAGKVSVLDGGFSTLDLSTGQRKRLALLVALLEDRPIMVFDEWAADQDPIFRKKFYEEMLPAWKSSGKTIVAATHDDRYFSVADRIVALENGRIQTSSPAPDL
ncbi:cyclic peptide export ABC transporter [Allochromatium humboldtianum]|uniref:Cyclic peptide export ABC transporter n=1 Tax=Allochromatium humboldtianum TaxID=504901 RepID=A0A850RKV2_9GAMM|nr:cyclic peptide export ABC transporter [Allochromatium humboldtianum]NVZ10131.1 cyclic peptide export ABC transporter [Allochromatium humboldtianum]